jgi:transketolase
LRQAFIETLVTLARQDQRIVFLTADLGFNAVEPFAEAFPDRFFNVGVSEQNMVGMSTGLAEAGYIPFVYSITPFAVLRPYEFIRNGPIMHKLPVRIVGVGGGMEYGTNGATHYGLEDVGVLRLQPGINVICPSDGGQTRTALAATWNLPGPTYYRLGKDDRIVVPGLDGRFETGRVQLIGDGRDVLIIAMGNAAKDAVDASAALASRGCGSTVAVVASVSPAPVDDLVHLLRRFPAAITVEAHYIWGGVGSMVAEIVAEHGIACRIVRCGVDRLPDGTTGSQATMHALYGISSSALVDRTLSELSRQSPTK